MTPREFETSPLVVGAGELWPQAIHADFLSAIGDGNLPREAFERWLVQDYLFAQGLTTFEAIAVAKTPRPAQKVLIAGLAAMDAEMDWFEEMARSRNFHLSALPHPTCRRYVDFLVASAYSLPFEVLLAVLYSVEVSYLCAWGELNPIGPYAEFIQRWSNPQFVEYVRQLLQLCDGNPHEDQQQYFNEVLQHERDFWRMTWEG